MRAIACKAYLGLSWLFLLAVAIQFFLAGLGVLGGGNIDLHRQWGFYALHLIPILMFVAALLGRMGGRIIGSTAALFALVFIQPIFTQQSLNPRWLRSLHVVNALFITVLGLHLTRWARSKLANAGE